jgi:glucans biosynthesis protein C
MDPRPGSFPRRYDLDWIRIGAFLLLILYHVGMYYVTWDWHVKSPQASSTIEPLMLLVNPWRLSILFLVSGAATAFMLRRLTPGGLARSRSGRLLLPLLLGMLVIVPPQSYFEVVEKAGYTDGYMAFWARYLAADRSFCRDGDCLIVPTWNHLWFVAYLWAYTMLLAAVLALRPQAAGRAREFLERRLAGPGVLLLPWLLLALMRVTLLSTFPPSHALVDDWYNHAQYFAVFAFGFMCADSRPLWDAIVRSRRLALVAAIASYVFLAWYFGTFTDERPPHDGLRMTQRVIYAANQWAWIVALLGYGRTLLDRDSAPRRYLTEAIFPFYIVHQTVIIAAAVWLRPAKLAAGAEALVLLAITAVACVLTYEIVRRVRWLRPLFGLKRLPRP